jgi:hypothetical protein
MAKLPDKIQKLFEQKDKFIQLNRDNLEKSVIKLQDKLLKDLINNVISELDTENGVILQNQHNYRIIEQLDKVYKQFNEINSLVVVRNMAGTIQGINKLNKIYYKELLINETTAKKFDNIINKTNKMLSLRLGVDNTKIVEGGFLDTFVTDTRLNNELKQLVIRDVAAQRPVAELIDEMSKKVIGNDIVSGKFEQYYRQFGYDIYQEYDRTYGKMMADEFKMDYAIYQGGLIKDSRDFCRDHNNRVYTREEISKFDNWTYESAKNISGFHDSGSNSGIPSYISSFPGYDPYVHLGGFNCRHSLTWITKDLAINYRPELNEK